MVRIDRVIDWEAHSMQRVMDFLDFGGKINVVLEYDVEPKILKKSMPTDEEALSLLNNYGLNSVSVTVEDNRGEFENIRKKWLEEPASVTKHVIARPDDLLLWALQGDPDYSNDRNVKSHIFKLLFKGD